MKSIVVMTFYQLMHSVALALTLAEKPMLYFSRDYLGADEDLLARIRRTGIFHDVVGMLEATYAEPFYEDLRQAYGSTNGNVDSIGSSIFEKYLEPYYSEIFRDADKADDIYVYNDFQRHYYYITKHFEHIIGVEDGYCSIGQQIRVHRFKGRYKLLEPYIDKYYPAPLYKDRKVKKIISSTAFPELDSYYTGLMEILDFNQLVEINRDRYTQAMIDIFDVAKLEIQAGSIIYLGQPMSRGLYCTAGENYLLHRKALDEAAKDGRHIYIKPHPADVLDYTLFASDQISVLPKEFPLEVLGYLGIKFEKSISFGSTSVVSSFVNQNIRLYNDNNLDIGKVRKFIRDYTNDQKIVVNLYLKAKSTDPQGYLNLYGYLGKHRFIRLNITVLVDEALGEEGLRYYAPEHLKKRIKEHRQVKGTPKSAGLYSYERRRLSRLMSGRSGGISIKTIAAKWDSDEDIYNKFVRGERFDYFMISNLDNPGFYIANDLYTLLTKNAVKGVFYNNFTLVDGNPQNRVYLGMESGHSLLMGRLSNIAIHSCMTGKLDGLIENKNSFASILESCRDFLERRNISMHQDEDFYLGIEDGTAYFREILMRIEDQEGVMGSGLAISPHIVTEYFNWAQIRRNRFEQEDLSALLTGMPLQSRDGQLLMQGIIYNQLEDQYEEHKKRAYLNEEFYNYYNAAIDRLVKNHSLLRVQKRIQALVKIRDFLREARMIASWNLGEDLTRKLEGTKILRKIYYYVMKKEREVI